MWIEYEWVEGEIVVCFYDEYRDMHMFENEFDQKRIVKKGDVCFRKMFKRDAFVGINKYKSLEEQKKAFEKTTKFLVDNLQLIKKMQKEADQIMIWLSIRSDSDQIGVDIPHDFSDAVAKLGIGLDVDTIIGLEDDFSLHRTCRWIRYKTFLILETVKFKLLYRKKRKGSRMGM